MSQINPVGLIQLDRRDLLRCVRFRSSKQSITLRDLRFFRIVEAVSPVESILSGCRVFRIVEALSAVESIQSGCQAVSLRLDMM